MAAPCAARSRIRAGAARSCIAAAIIALLAGAAPAAAAAEPLRVCSDPNNMPFSNRSEEGFENALAELIADEIGRTGVEYTWHPQRRGFVRNTLDKGRCDVVMGVSAGYERAATTSPYYRSSDVFVYPERSGLDVRSVDNPALRELRIGVHVVGDDYANTPGAAALGRRGIVENLVGYTVYGDYSEPSPPARLVEAVAGGAVDIAVVWGPLAGYFAPRQPVALHATPIAPDSRGEVTFEFGISMAVRRGDDALLAELERAIDARREDIRAVLERYGVPLAGAREHARMDEPS